MSFYNKYRPKSFEDMVGTSAEIIKLQIDKNVTSHAYIFAGPPGTGKTTLARIAALNLLCDENDTDAKDLIINDNHPDVYEINCAVNNGIDNVRENIIQLARLSPTLGKYKIFILDECHMLTTQAQTSLIKIVEEPPSHVKFFFCTTDPNKILRAIQTRCQTFLMKKFSNNDIMKILIDVCNKEQLNYENTALEIIAKDSEGSARTALSILQQLSVLDTISENKVREVLNKSPKHFAYDLCNSILNLDRSEACRLIQAANSEGRNIENLLNESANIFKTAFQYVLFKTKKVDRVPEIESIAKSVSTMLIVDITEQLYKISSNIRQTVSEDLVAMTGILKLIDWYAKQLV